MAKKEKESASGFEENLEQLEKIVRDLESGKLTLEESLKKFERGVDLYRGCKDQLSNAEKKIAKLTEDLEERGEDL